MSDFKIVDQDTGETWNKDSRADCEDAIEMFGDDRNLEIVPPGKELTDHHGEPIQKEADGGSTTVVEDESPTPQQPQEPTQEETAALDQLGESIDTDPLDVLPGYMITHVDGKPSLNKRGVSVLAYHYNIDVLERDVVAYPHETDYETAVVEIMVQGGDGRKFAGIGEAHVDETPKHQLLRMAETRAYKRAVIFATGTGIVGYQELMSELQ